MNGLAHHTAAPQAVGDLLDQLAQRVLDQRAIAHVLRKGHLAADRLALPIGAHHARILATR